jgi:hypothetical protein
MVIPADVSRRPAGSGELSESVRGTMGGTTDSMVVIQLPPSAFTAQGSNSLTRD